MSITLPTDKTVPKTSIGDYPLLIYGDPGVGKTTLASKFPDAVFLATEPGQDALSVYRIPVASWADFAHAIAALRDQDHSFKTVVIDTITNLWDMCCEYVRQKHGFMHESDLAYGKGWHLVGEEFEKRLVRLSLMDMGLVMICHSTNRDINQEGKSQTKIMPDLPTTARKVITPMVSMIFYLQVVHTDDGETRFIRTRASDKWIAKTRTPEGRQMPDPIPLDYDQLFEAFETTFKGE